MSGLMTEAKVEGLIARVEATQMALEGSILEQSTLLRLFLDRIEKLLESKAPKDDNGPTIQEILAQVAFQFGEQTTILRKIDRHLTGGATKAETDSPEMVEHSTEHVA